MNKSNIEKLHPKKITDGLHLSKLSLGYWILSVGQFYYPFCGSLMIGKSSHYKTLKDAIKSIENAQ